MSTKFSDYDGAWKDALDAYFPHFTALFCSSMHAQIDWAHKPVFLEKELQAVLRSAKRGRRHVDKLISLRLLGGEAALALIHIEVQARHDAGFSARMFIYHTRLHEKYPDHSLVSVAVLTGRVHGPPQLSYAYQRWGCSLNFTFPVIRLESWRKRMPELISLAPANPFAVVILAQLEANATRDGLARLARKTELMRRLYYWRFSPDNVIQLFRIIDAMMALPEALEPAFEQAISQLEEETQMTYITSVERVQLKREREEGIKIGEHKGKEIGKEIGRMEGIAGLLATLITRKFGQLPDWGRIRLNEADEATLNRWAVQVLDAQRIEDVFA
ncbi:MAG: hypothetical protein WBA83_01280 [Burkholderiaceae bacterium]